jgi:hypothetical protein
VEGEEEVEEEDEEGNKKFICFMGSMMFIVILSWFFSPFVSFNFIRFYAFVFFFLVFCCLVIKKADHYYEKAPVDIIDMCLSKINLLKVI